MYGELDQLKGSELSLKCVYPLMWEQIQW